MAFLKNKVCNEIKSGIIVKIESENIDKKAAAGDETFSPSEEVDFNATHLI
jgi:hypothetical protein